MTRLGRRVVSHAAEVVADDPDSPADAPNLWGFLPEEYSPDVALVNYYDGQAKMGMHQDKDELDPAPVVSLSLGDTCIFRFGNTDNRNKPYEDIRLASGDAFVFGGPARFAFHGVTKILDATAPEQDGWITSAGAGSTSRCAPPAGTSLSGSRTQPPGPTKLRPSSRMIRKPSDDQDSRGRRQRCLLVGGPTDSALSCGRRAARRAHWLAKACCCPRTRR